MKPLSLLLLTVGMLLSLSGCGDNQQSNTTSVLSKLPSQEQVKVETVMKSGGNLHLPKWLPFTPTGGTASKSVSATDQTLLNTVTVSLYDKSELLIVKPYTALPVHSVPGSPHLANGVPAAFESTKKWSILAWSSGPGEGYTIYSAKIINGESNSPRGPDLSKNELIKIADSVQ